MVGNVIVFSHYNKGYPQLSQNIRSELNYTNDKLACGRRSECLNVKACIRVPQLFSFRTIIHKFPETIIIKGKKDLILFYFLISYCINILTKTKLICIIGIIFQNSPR